MGELAQYKKGPFGSSITKSMFVPDSATAIKVYEQKNAINKDATLGSYFISEEKYESLKGFEIFPNDIIVSCAGTIGETFVMPETMRKGIINQALMKISLYDLGIIDFYLIYFDCQLKNAAREQGHGVALKNIPPFDVLKKYLVPVPPIQEQTRIVNSVNDLLGTVNGIDKTSDELNDLISSIKSKILDLAIRGELVPQSPDDEPASVLLDRIRTEKEELIKAGKIKRDKKESIIFKGEDNSYYEKIGKEATCIDNELPYNIPYNWSWCRLDLVATVFGRIGFRGYTKEDLVAEGEGAITLSPSNIIENKMCYKNVSYISWQKYEESPEIQIDNGDILLVKTGSSFGKSARVYDLPQKATINPQFVVLKNHRINSEYLCSILQSSYAKDVFKKFVVGTAIPTFTQANLNSLLLPIPPLNEQSRICNSLSQIFTSLRTIEKSLN